MENDNTTLEQENPELDTFVEQVYDEDAKKVLQTEIARKKHWREKYQKVDEELREYKEKEKLVVEKPVAESSTPQVTDEIETVLNLRSQNYSDAEILTLRKYAKKMNTPIAEILNDPFIKSGIEREREKSKVEQSTPSPSNRSVIVDNKNWAEMTPAERESNFSKVRDNFKGGNRSSE